MQVNVRIDGDDRKLSKWLKNTADPLSGGELRRIGEDGVAGLRANSPIDTGEMANSWRFQVVDRIPTNGVKVIEWSNSVRVGRSLVQLAVLRQFGHATRDGGWVQGVDYINEPIQAAAARAGRVIEGAIRRN